MKKGQKVVTIGGIYGEIVSLTEDHVMLQVADKVEMRFARTAIANIANKKVGHHMDTKEAVRLACKTKRAALRARL